MTLHKLSSGWNSHCKSTYMPRNASHAGEKASDAESTPDRQYQYETVTNAPICIKCGGDAGHIRKFCWQDKKQQQHAQPRAFAVLNRGNNKTSNAFSCLVNSAGTHLCTNSIQTHEKKWLPYTVQLVITCTDQTCYPIANTCIYMGCSVPRLTHSADF